MIAGMSVQITSSLRFTAKPGDASCSRKVSVVWTMAPNTATATAATVLGSGVVAPFQRDGKGDFANATGVPLIKSNIGQILGTIALGPRTLGEIPWRPEFGSLLQLLRFMNNDAILRELASQYVVDAIELWEPRVLVKDVKVESKVEQYLLEITIRYDIVSRRRTLIQPGVRQTFQTQLET